MSDLKLSQRPLKDLLQSEEVKVKFKDVLGKRAASFITSVLQLTTQSKMLAECDPVTVLNSAMVAATLDLPINPNLGFAYIIPYRNKAGTVAQFQMGYKGFIQLAQRTGLYKTISATEVYEGQLLSIDPLEGFKFDWQAKKSETIIGYAGYFRLLNGFEKTLFMTVEQMEAHGKRYSQSYKNNSGLWVDNKTAMGLKTVLKLLLSKFAPLSIEMQQALINDQGVIRDDNTIDYPDNQEEAENKELTRLQLMIGDAKTAKDVENLRTHAIELDAELLIENRLKEIEK